MDHVPINGTSVRFLCRDSSTPRSLRHGGHQYSVELLARLKERAALHYVKALTILSYAADVIEAAVARVLAKRKSCICSSCAAIETLHSLSMPYFFPMSHALSFARIVRAVSLPWGTGVAKHTSVRQSASSCVN